MVSRSFGWIGFCLAGLLLAAPAAANDLDLLMRGGVAPNVMIVLDTSGSMAAHMYDNDFNPDRLYPRTCWTVATLSGTSCPGLGNPSDQCPDNDDSVSFSSALPQAYSYTCNGVTRTIWIDKAFGSSRWGGTTTDYAKNYLNWLFGTATTAQLADEPRWSRSSGAANMLRQLVNRLNPDRADGGYDENVRFGLTSFDRNSMSRTPITVPIASGNKPQIMSALSDPTFYRPSGYTPLGETLVDVGRYFAGEHGLGSFPISPVLPSPIDLACRKNFVILTTDGQPTRDGNDHFGSAFMDTIGNQDGDLNECVAVLPGVCKSDKTLENCVKQLGIVCPGTSGGDEGPIDDTALATCVHNYTLACNDRPQDGRDDGFDYGTDGTDWLDDVAYYLYHNDLSDLDGIQNVITYTVGMGIDHPLLLDAATNGGGAYFTSYDLDLLQRQLESALLDIILRATSFAPVSVPSSRGSSGDGLFWAWFLPSLEPVWDGHLEAFALSATGEPIDLLGASALDPTTGTFSTTRVPYWDAGAELATNTSRTLYTTLSGARVAFSSTTLSEADLGLVAGEIGNYPNYPSSGVATLPQLREAVVGYAHGRDAFDEDGDGNATELRSHVLGDIFHSAPVVVGSPPSALRYEEGFGVSSDDTPFMERYKDRDRVLYVGANDGMLHAFHAGDYDVSTRSHDLGTGEELFGYVPGLLLDKIKRLPLNMPRADWFVDGPPVVADAWLGDPNDPNDTTRNASEWATVLVVGMREGGAGYLALDVTDPNATSPSQAHGPYPKLLWEFTDANLGQSWSEPVITRVKVRGPSGSGDHCGKDDGDVDCREQWVAIFGGGYAETGNPNGGAYDPNNLAGNALFVVALDTGDLLARVVHDPTGVAGPAAMQFAIPSAPAVLDLDFDGFADLVYVGDLGGQVWKWDLSAVGEDSGGDGQIDNWSAGRFFSAPVVTLSSGSSHYKSIFYPPSATLHSGRLVLAFATGERTDLNYEGEAASDENNRFYVVKDLHPHGSGAFPSTPVGESDLTDITNADQDTNPNDLGFYFAARDGEKFVAPQTLFAGFAIATSFVPAEGASTSCSPTTGESYLYVFDVLSGLGFYFEAEVTTGGSARRIAVGPGVPTAPRISYAGDSSQIYVSTSAGALYKGDAPPPSWDPVEIIYWRQNF